MQIFYFIIYCLLASFALVLEKLGMRRLENPELNYATFKQVMHNPLIISGVSLAALALVLWLYLLSRYNLTFIQPMAAVTFIIVAFLGYFFLHEPITFTRWIGILTIVIGAYLLNL